MSDVLVMEENLFGAGGVHHFATNRTPVIRQMRQFVIMTIWLNWRFGDCIGREADGHERNYEPNPPARNQTASKSQYQQNP